MLPAGSTLRMFRGALSRTHRWVREGSTESRSSPEGDDLAGPSPPRIRPQESPLRTLVARSVTPDDNLACRLHAEGSRTSHEVATSCRDPWYQVHDTESTCPPGQPRLRAPMTEIVMGVRRPRAVQPQLRFQLRNLLPVAPVETELPRSWITDFRSSGEPRRCVVHSSGSRLRLRTYGCPQSFCMLLRSSPAFDSLLSRLRSSYRVHAFVPLPTASNPVIAGLLHS